METNSTDSTMPLIYDLTFPEMKALMSLWGEPAYRARQIWQGLYHQFVNAPDQFSNLSSSFRDKLNLACIFQPLTPLRFLRSSDGHTEKILFKLADGSGIETVLMAYHKRNTLCISTQVGCAMGCKFCATGQMGFRRHLSSGEIIAQVMYFAQSLKKESTCITNIVIMGMGEPFHNYDNTMAAIDRLNDPSGYNFGARRFTISTVGLIPAIRRFTSEKRQVNLAISLHSAEDALRLSMLPINKRYPVDELLAACHDYVKASGRRITFEWALVKEVNDTPEQAALLAKKLRGLLCHVNAIPLNPTKGYPGVATSRERAEKFRDILERSGIPCTIRLRRGMDIQAGCGQLLYDG
jgi:23S rRNA (adenine2503-C2)-methyltransferase